MEMFTRYYCLQKLPTISLTDPWLNLSIRKRRATTAAAAAADAATAIQKTLKRFWNLRRMASLL